MTDNNDFDLFAALGAIDNKNYSYYDNLSEESKSKVSYYLLLKWITSISNDDDLLLYYISSVDYYANKYGFDENISKHPKLQWLMLCASGPKIGRIQRKWVSQIPENISLLKEPATLKKVKKYLSGEFGLKETDRELTELAKEYVDTQNKKYFLASAYHMLKLEDVDILSTILTDDEIRQYKTDSGL